MADMKPRTTKLPPSAPRDVKIAALAAAAGNAPGDAAQVLSALHKLGWTLNPLRCGNGGGSTSNRDIERLRDIAKQGFISKLGAAKRLGKSRDWVSYWVRREGIEWEKRPKGRQRLDIRPAIADLAMARLCNTMAALRG